MWGDLVRRGSGQLVALMPEPEVGLLAETIVAFANADGGTIVLGIDETGRSTGAVYPEEMEALLRDALRECRPPLEVDCQQEEVAGGFVFYVRVPRSTELHSLSDGRVVIRRMGENRPLSGEEIRHLAATKSSGDYEMQVVAGARREDLDEEVIGEFLQRWQEKQRRPWTRSAEELLVQIGALDDEGHPTVAGLLLFGREPQVFLPQSGLVFVKFLGTEPRGEGGEAGYGRRENIVGPLARIIQRAWTVVLEEMRTGAVVKGLERVEQTEYPPCARPWSTPWPTGTIGCGDGGLRCGCSRTAWKLSVREGSPATSPWITSWKSTSPATRASSERFTTGGTLRNWDWE